jgi:hypothetical protein
MKSRITVMDVAIALFCLAALKAVFELVARREDVNQSDGGNSVPA